MRKTLLKTFLNGILMSLFLVSGQSSLFSQTDTEFWFVKPIITEEHTVKDFKIVLTTREFAANVEIEMPAEPAFTPLTFSIPAYTTYTHFVPQASAEFFLMENSTVTDELSLPIAFRDNIGNKAILISSTAPINAYVTQTANNNSDIYTLKGTNGIGKEFIIPFQEHGYNMHPFYYERSFSSIEVIAIEDATVVEITPPNGKTVYRNGAFPNQVSPYTVSLNRGQVYTCPPGWDPTVTRNNVPNSGWWGIEGSQHLGGIIVKVLSGSGVAVIKKDDSVRKYTTGGWDIIADQWIPYKGIIGGKNDILGTEYVIMRGALNDGWEYVYAASPENDTRIWWGNVDTLANPIPNIIINKGEQVGIQFDNGAFTNNNMEIISNKPLSILHVSGYGFEMGGAAVPPIDKCNGSVSVSFARDMVWPLYLNIMVRNGAQDNFLIDGVVRSDIIDPLSFVPVGSSGDWLATQLYYPEGDLVDFPVGLTRTISNTENVFHLGLINGNTSGGCRYGYYSDFNEIKVGALFIQEKFYPSSTIRACRGDSIQLYASGGTNYYWWPSTNLSNTGIASPKLLVNNNAAYFVEVSGACNITDTAVVLIEVSDYPIAEFTLNKDTACAPFELEINNTSTGATNYYWDLDNDSIFEVETTDTLIQHTYLNSTDKDSTYNISLLAENEFGCKNQESKNFTIMPELIASLSIDVEAGCSPVSAIFTNNSVGYDSLFLSYGDGTGTILTNSSLLTHTYSNSGTNVDTNIVNLIAKNALGCIKYFTDTIIIYPEINADFTSDLTEGCNPLTVSFTNTSSSADYYKWGFGDGYSSTTNTPPTHIYQNPNDIDMLFLVSLNTESVYGCRDSVTSIITVYSNLNSQFSIENNEACSPFDATIENNSLGNTHNTYQWFIDGISISGSPIDTSDLNYTFENNEPTEHEYIVKLIATNTHACTSEYFDSITVFPELITSITNSNDVSCFGAEDGSTTVTILSGTPPYSYLWSNGEITPTITNLSGDIYYVTVTDANNCSSISNVLINEPGFLSINSESNNVSCNGLSDGSIDVSATTWGTSFLWSTGETVPAITGLSVGWYTLTVNSSSGCVTAKSFLITEPNPLDILTESISDSICPSSNSGNIDIYTNGGTPPYIYNWSNGAFIDSIYNLEAGDYNVSVTDANGCTSTKEFIIDSISPFDNQEICIVGVDPNLEKNTITWKKNLSNGIDNYVIYKHNPISDTYESIAFVPFWEETYFDSLSNPSVNSNQYKIAIIDTCGNESALSEYHKPLFLSLTPASELVILAWEPYNTESGNLDFLEYIIYRGQDSTELTQIDTVSSLKFSYIDSEAPAGKVFYRIAGIMSSSCNSKSSELIFSNLVRTDVQTNINSLDQHISLNVHPNPFKDEVNIQFSLETEADLKIEIYDIVGKKITTLINNKEGTGLHKYPFSPSNYGYSNGIYYLKITIDNESTTRKIIQIK